MNEVVTAVRDAFHELCIAVLQIPDSHLSHLRKEFLVDPKWVGCTADIDPVAVEISCGEIRVG